MNLNEFAKNLPANYSEHEFIGLMNQVIDLKSAIELPKSQRDALFDGAQFLVDFLLLAREVKGELEVREGQPIVEYSGPFVENILTRPEDQPVDPEHLFALTAPSA
ncbi:hypothetical protein CKO11_08665 [Rhodobacter sp. TJ_12]|uniref:hypothetical protein n=1 Tax=Rhodobacter sp. TJ_12 TaxID=2029399 RepID=UPI001CBC8033|nr:hypothetical protein [Rhodobacter sp. TJ_12]MBZ4022528.1 hypothetical protein [Rhodobacter sp. TJ_12]